MLYKLSLMIVPAALVLGSAVTAAAPKTIPHKPLAVPTKPGRVQSMMPNMTQFQKPHIIAAFDVVVPGRQLLMDTSGKVIGQTNLSAVQNAAQPDIRSFAALPGVSAPRR